VFDPVVRPAVPEDHAALVDLERQARAGLVGTRGGDRWLAEHEPIADRWAEEIGQGDAAMFIADLDHLVVGFLALRFQGDGTAHVAAVYVHPEARQCGFGDAMMEAAVAAARSHGSERIEGEALPGDRDAKNLYERAGITARLITLSAPLDKLRA
jgi:ribosomal protein S18 acetylase RimI-like enzyme